MAENAPLVLASASPRRLQLLKQIGIVPGMVDPPQIDEEVRARELPRDLAKRLACAKCDLVSARHPDAFVLAADTVVACGRRALGKPDDRSAAEAMLRLLSGRRHRVYTAIAIRSPEARKVSRCVRSDVRFKRLSDCEISDYLAGGEWSGKAGGYAIQGRAGAFVKSIGGSYSNIVGLPLYEVSTVLKGLGFRAPGQVQ